MWRGKNGSIAFLSVTFVFTYYRMDCGTSWISSLVEFVIQWKDKREKGHGQMQRKKWFNCHFFFSVTLLFIMLYSQTSGGTIWIFVTLHT